MRRTLDIMRRDDGTGRDGISGGYGSNAPPPITLRYITNTSGASAYRAATGAGFRGSSTSTTAVVVYVSGSFTAATGVIAGYGATSGASHSWDFHIALDGAKYGIRPRLRTSAGQEVGRYYRIQTSDLGKVLRCVATFDGTYLRHYVNGCEVGATVISGTYTSVGTQRFAMLNNNPLSDPLLDTENVGLISVLTANSVMTPEQIKTWDDDTLASLDAEPPVFPGGITVNRWVASDAYDDPSTNDAADFFTDTVSAVNVQQVVAGTQAVASIDNSYYLQETRVPAFRLTGANNFETVNHSIGNSSTPFTVNLLVHVHYAPNTGSNEGIISYRQNGVTRGWGLRRINSTGGIDAFVFDGSASLVETSDFTTTSDANKNRTHLFTASHDGSNLRLYCDGSAVGSAVAITGYTAPSSADSLIIGDTAGTNLPFLSGSVVGFSIVEGSAWTETEHDALFASILAANDMVDDATYPATAVWAASDNTAVGNWTDIAGGNAITKVGTPTLVYVARSRFGAET